MIAVPQAAIELAKRFEGFHRVPKHDPGRAHPYVCPAGYWTIGYGHLCDPKHPPITEGEAEAYFPLGKANGKWPDTVAKRKTYFSKEWRTWQMSDHLPLFIELRIDFTEKYLKRIRMGEQPVDSPTPDAVDD